MSLWKLPKELLLQIIVEQNSIDYLDEKELENLKEKIIEKLDKIIDLIN